MIKLSDIVNLAKEREYRVDIEKYEVENNIYIRRIENVSGDISFYYDPGDEEVRINYHVEGEMVVPCAISLEDIYLPFDLSDDDLVVFKQDEEGFFIDGDRSIEELVMNIVLPEVPIKVVKNEKIEYSRGDGWVFISEEDFEKGRENEVDPRMEKLMDYKFEEDD